MRTSSDAELISEAFRFLSAGFDQAAKSGLKGKLTTSVDGAIVATRDVQAQCNVEQASFGHFSVRLPNEFLVRAIGTGESRLVLEGEDAKGGASFHGPPQDGSETYRLKRVEWAFRDRDREGFALYVDIELGDPIAKTFVYHAPRDQSGIIYRGEVEVPYSAIFDYVFPTTKPQAEALRGRLLDVFGLDVAMPAFTVNA